MSDRSVHAHLTTEAHQGFQTFCDENGFSISGLLEAIGTHLNDRIEGSDLAHLSVGLLSAPEVIAAARQVDARRRGR